MALIGTAGGRRIVGAPVGFVIILAGVDLIKVGCSTCGATVYVDDGYPAAKKDPAE
jgi:hypothetical protein